MFDFISRFLQSHHMMEKNIWEKKYNDLNIHFISRAHLGLHYELEPILILITSSNEEVNHAKQNKSDGKSQEP